MPPSPDFDSILEALPRPPQPGARVVVALSGGVDSAVAALLLQRAGWDMHGLFMRNWTADDEGLCTSASDLQDARAVAREIGIVLHEVDFSAEYREAVFARFLEAYRRGCTPNPDVLCNREIKFGICTAYARRLGAHRFATGHYARLEITPEGPRLLRARDENKDQTYFLHAVRPGELAQAIFPLGALQKAEVRAIAREAGLPVHAKRDSTGICFIGERPFAQFLGRFLPQAPGPVEDERGVVVGEHRGLAFHTIGQRSGLRIGGRHGADAAPWYVAAKDLDRNALIVVQGKDHPALLSRALLADAPQWLSEPRSRDFECLVRLRHRQPLQCARAKLLGARTLRLDFESPQRAVTPGQYAVLYDGERCLGGAAVVQAIAIIDARQHAVPEREVLPEDS